MRVLLLTHRLPYPPNRGDRIRAFHIVRSLASRVELDLVSLVHDGTELAAAARVADLGVRVAAFRVPYYRNRMAAGLALAGTRPLTHVLLDAPGLLSSVKKTILDRRPDVVLAYCSGMARFALEPPLSEFPLVLDLVDVDSAKWAALADTVTEPKRWIYRREARHLARFEREAAMRAHTTLVVNEREARLLKQLAPEATIRIVRAGVDVTRLRPRTVSEEAPHVIFCGVMNYAPNVEGVSWFARDVWPAIRERRPDARFRIVGSNPARAIRRLTSERHGIEVTGTVPEVRDYLWNAAVSVAPLLTARGVQTKVIEALAAGLPTVVTSRVLEGLPQETCAGCLVADEPTVFAEQVLSLLALSGQQRRAFAARADLKRLSWELQLDSLYGILAEAAAAPRVMKAG